MKIQFIRHATAVLWINNLKILIDPVLAPKGTYPPVKKTANQNPNPLTDLPVSLKELIDCDAVLITHLHQDHFDQAAIDTLPKHIPILCSHLDAKKLMGYGFINIYPIKTQLNFKGISFHRTTGKHAHGLLALQMGAVSGFIIKASPEPSLYLLGDTVWCGTVKKALKVFQPDIAIGYFGSAQFTFGKPITMGLHDISRLKAFMPDLNLICIHLEAWNHCMLRRDDLKKHIQEASLINTSVPNEGEVIDFSTPSAFSGIF